MIQSVQNLSQDNQFGRVCPPQRKSETASSCGINKLTNYCSRLSSKGSPSTKNLSAYINYQMCASKNVYPSLLLCNSYFEMSFNKKMSECWNFIVASFESCLNRKTKQPVQVFKR